MTDLFESGHLFVRHHLTPPSEPRLKRLGARGAATAGAACDHGRGLSACSTAAAARTRRWPSWLGCGNGVRRYRSLGRSLDKLQSPNLEKALTFLDDKLMPATSNAVERGNRRHRKMQKTVYRVRRQQWLKGRLALDLRRDQQAAGRQATSSCLHKARQRG